jgi:predicted PurR-regulated permease PerM
VAAYLAIDGEYGRSIAMLVWGTVVIGTADNIIRPLVIGGRTHIPTILLFFSIIGGLQVYGFVGLFLGPAIVATLVAFARIFREQLRHGREVGAGARSRPTHIGRPDAAR